ncbi:MAG: SDR family NAD(P)-dependent oxidoreductase, partial [Planctomycetes bacterium]|nr:SDR family NAD(P)-dependent oxidoreductase [Planctomycetota bacterium]
MAGSENQLALVTGASKGVGRGIALGLAAAGYDVIVNYHHDEAGAAETAREILALGRECSIIQADVGDSGQVRAMFSKIAHEHGRLDVAVNNAGCKHGPL